MCLFCVVVFIFISVLYCLLVDTQLGAVACFSGIHIFLLVDCLASFCSPCVVGGMTGNDTRFLSCKSV